MAAERTSSPKEFVINNVISVSADHLKKNWLPTCREVEGLLFFKFDRWDRSVIMALTGKGLELRSSKAPHLLNNKTFEMLLEKRNQECQRRYSVCMRQAAEAAGEEWRPTSKAAAMAQQHHNLIVGPTVEIELPLHTRDDITVGPLQAWIWKTCLCVYVRLVCVVPP